MKRPAVIEKICLWDVPLVVLMYLQPTRAITSPRPTYFWPVIMETRGSCFFGVAIELIAKPHRIHHPFQRFLPVSLIIPTEDVRIRSPYQGPQNTHIYLPALLLCC